MGRDGDIHSAGEITRLRQILWDIYALCGCDQDGDPVAAAPGVYTPDIPELAVTAVRDLREAYDEE